MTVPPRSWPTAVFMVFVLLGFSWGSWLSRFPAIRDELDFSLTQMSMVVLSASGGSLLGLITAGRTVNRLGSTRSLVLWLTVMGVSTPAAIVTMLNVSVPLGLTLFAVYGFAFGTADVAINVNGTVVERRLRTPRMSLFHAGFSIGSVAALGAGALMEVVGVGPVSHLTVVAICFLVVGMVALRFIRPEGATAGTVPSAARSTRSAPQSIQRYSPWRNMTIVLIGVVALSGALAEGVAGDWLPLALVDEYGLDNDSGVLVLALFYAGGLTTRLLGDRLVFHIGRAGALRLTLGIGIVGVSLVVLSPVTWLATLGALFWGVGAALTFPLPISAAADHPETATRDVAAVTAVGYSAFVLGPVLFGLLGDQVGLRAAFSLLVVILLAGWSFSSRTRPRGGDFTLSVNS